MLKKSSSTNYEGYDDGDESREEDDTLSTDQESSRRFVLKHIVFYVLWAVVFALEFLYREALFNKSIELQLALQDHLTDFGIFVFQAFSRWGDGGPYFAAFVVVFNWDKRSRAFYYIMFLTCCAFLMNTTKMAYHEPRPFMYDPKIKVFGCSAEYGNPSGHSLFAAAFNFFFFLDICHGSKQVSKVKYYSLLATAILLTVCIGFARFYVGVHTIN